METPPLRLEDLLPFLNGRADWTLRCRKGELSLRFGRKKFKFKGVTAVPGGMRGAGAAKAVKAAAGRRRATTGAGDDFMRAKWLREIGAAGWGKMIYDRCFLFPAST